LYSSTTSLYINYLTKEKNTIMDLQDLFFNTIMIVIIIFVKQITI